MISISFKPVGRHFPLLIQPDFLHATGAMWTDEKLNMLDKDLTRGTAKRNTYKEKKDNIHFDSLLKKVTTKI